jgi:rhodanese-related sulfurtransferase
VQAIDRWVGTRGARLVLVDDTSIRAIITAHWLKQMGWDVQILDRGLEEVVLETGSGVPASSVLSTAPVIEPAEAARWLAQGAAAVSLETSAEYRKAHPDGAVWSIRPRLDRLPASVLESDRLVLFAEDDASGQLAAVDLAELTSAHLTLVRGGTRGWARAGLPVTASPGDPPDEQRIDYLFWNHDRHAGNRNAMRAYLQWETELPAQIAADGLAGFRLAAP